MGLKSMKMSPEKAHEMTSPCAPKADAPLYPYGLCLRLDEETLKKLGVKELPKVGGKLNIRAVVEVASVSQHENQNSEQRSLELQITDMELSGHKRQVGTDKLYEKK